MLLKEMLESLNPEMRIAIGTTEGCGYLYFGTPSEALSSLQKVFNDSKRSIARRLKKAKENDGADRLSLETIEEHKRYLNNYTNPLERIVADHYVKEVDDHEAIIIQGHERGLYWLEEEFLKARKNKATKTTKKKKPKETAKKEPEVLRNYKEFYGGVEEVEKYKRTHKKESFVYFCDGKQCDNGYCFCQLSNCFHTSDVSHAFNKGVAMKLYFYEVEPGKWIECTEGTAKQKI